MVQLLHRGSNMLAIFGVRGHSQISTLLSPRLYLPNACARAHDRNVGDNSP